MDLFNVGSIYLGGYSDYPSEEGKRMIFRIGGWKPKEFPLALSSMIQVYVRPAFGPANEKMGEFDVIELQEFNRLKILCASWLEHTGDSCSCGYYEDDVYTVCELCRIKEIVTGEKYEMP